MLAYKQKMKIQHFLNDKFINGVQKHFLSQAVFFWFCFQFSEIEKIFPAF